MYSFLKKNLRKILIWCTGFTVLILIGNFSDEQPDFIEEQGILTWRLVDSLIVIITCYGLTSKKPFWKALTEDVDLGKIQIWRKKIARDLALTV